MAEPFKVPPRRRGQEDAPLPGPSLNVRDRIAELLAAVVVRLLRRSRLDLRSDAPPRVSDARQDDG